MAARPDPLARHAGPTLVAIALNRARRDLGLTVRAAARGCGLPVRFVAAFELDRSHRVFRTAGYAEAFLSEYARYLGLDPRLVVRAFLTGYGIAVEDTEPLAPGRAARTSHRIARRRGRVVAAALSAVVLSTAVAAARAAPERQSERRVAPRTPIDAPEVSRPELPGGGRRLFPDYRVVAYYGSPVNHRMGRLGQGPPHLAVVRLLTQADAYRRAERPVLPAFELVATVATAHRGADGTYGLRVSDEEIQEYLTHIRGASGLLILDLQPGPVPFDREARRYEGFLRLPDVGLALDPEWRVGPGEVPGRTVGSVDAAEINRVIDWLARLVRRYDLPPKLLVIHQFNPSMITNRWAIHRPPEVAVTLDFDGVGSAEAKAQTYQTLARGLASSGLGIKLYYDQDSGLMTPRRLLRLEPEPDFVVYQ